MTKAELEAKLAETEAELVDARDRLDELEAAQKAAPKVVYEETVPLPEGPALLTRQLIIALRKRSVPVDSTLERMILLSFKEIFDAPADQKATAAKPA